MPCGAVVCFRQNIPDTSCVVCAFISSLSTKIDADPTQEEGQAYCFVWFKILLADICSRSLKRKSMSRCGRVLLSQDK